MGWSCWPAGTSAFIRSGGGISFMFRRFRRSGRVHGVGIWAFSAKLEAEGVFAAKAQKAAAAISGECPHTSRQTAASPDMLKVLRRFGFLKIKVFHVAVQGEGAAGGLCRSDQDAKPQIGR